MNRPQVAGSAWIITARANHARIQIPGADGPDEAKPLRHGNEQLGAQIIDINYGLSRKKVPATKAVKWSALCATKNWLPKSFDGRGQRRSALASHAEIRRLVRRAAQTACKLPESRASWHSSPRKVHGTAPAISSLYRRRGIRQHRRDQNKAIGTGIMQWAISISPQKGPCLCSRHTGADAVMIGDAAQGQTLILQ